jgi:hypothetical protein
MCAVHDAHNCDDMFVFLKSVEPDVLFTLRKRQDAQPVEFGMVEIAQASKVVKQLCVWE